ncbi:MAG: sulfite exporter TauE/SafE family protein [Rhodospirillales bacterium]|nr:sulfite exporter TauE/SafE family protein [Rhodospirillales bacterium]
MTLAHILLLLVAGFLGGTMNAIAGGGSFATFPAMIFIGMPSVAANASSTVALLPGGMTSAWAYRFDLRPVGGIGLAPMLAASVAGGLTGALLLLNTPSHAFDVMIPWLLALASLAFLFGGRAGAALRRHLRIRPGPVLAVQYVLGIYGGYFGGAVGIMMMAAWSLLENVTLKALNPAKMVMVVAANAIAVVCFAVAGAVIWPATLVTLIAAIAGGYVGARIGRFLPARLVRAVVLCVTIGMTAVFFWRVYGPA